MDELQNVPSDPVMKALAQPVSRRGFFGLTAIVGALFFTGSACGGRVTAYADEAGNAYFVVTILSREEIAALITNAADKSVLPGAEVTVTSRFNDKTATATTDQYGRAVLNIKALSQQCENSKAEDYFFWGSATIKKAGYREVALERYLLNGGPTSDQRAHLEFGTQPFNAATDGAYLRMVSFDGSDIQYNTLQMPKYEKDTQTHTLTVQVGCGAGKTATVKFLGNGTVLAKGTGVCDSATGYATISLEGHFVQDQAIGTVFSLDFAADGVAPQTAPLKLTLGTPEAGSDAPFLTDNALLSPGCGAGTGTPSWEASNADVKVDKNIINVTGLPFDSALRIVGDFPWMPVSYAQLPGGGMGISLNMQTFSIYNSDKGWFQNDGWMKTGATGMADKWAKKFEEGIDKSIDRAVKASTPFVNGKCYPEYFSSINAAFDASVTALIWKNKERWDGTLGVSGTFTLACEWGWQFQAGPLPMFATFDMTLLLVLAARMAMSFEKDPNELFKNPKFWYADGPSGGSNASINFTADGGFTIGVGIKGLCSVGLRGFVNIPFGIEFFQQKTGEAKKAFPHISLKISCGAQVAVQALFFKINHTVIESRKARLYDNWPETQALTSGEETQWEDFPGFYKDPAYDLGTTEMVMTTDDDLLANATDYVEMSVNAQGVTYLMDTSNHNPVIKNTFRTVPAPGFVNPYGSATQVMGAAVRPNAANAVNGGMAYDARMGIKPTIEEIISGQVFSDPRVKVVQLTKDTVYFCRLSIAKVEASNYSCTVVEDNGLYFLVPDNTTDECVATFVEPNDEEGIGYFQYPTYADVSYAVDGAAAAPAVASIDVPRYAGDTAADVNQRMRVVAELISREYNRKRPDYETVMANVANPSRVPRIRVVVTPFNTTTREWGEDDVLDFVISSEGVTTMRSNMNDVDFEVIANGDELVFGLVSCARTWVAQPSFEEQKENLFTSVLRYNPTKPEGQRISDVHSNLYESAKQGEYEWKATPIIAKNSSGASQLGLVCAGRRGADEAISVHYYGNSTANDLTPNTHVIIPTGNYKLNDNGHPFAYVDDSLKDAKGNSVVVVGWQYADETTTNDGVQPGYASQHAGVWTVGTSDGAQLGHWDFQGAQNLCPLGEGKGFAFVRPASANGQHLELCNVKFDTNKPAELSDPVVLGITDTGQFFASDNGNYLFGMRIMEGSAPEMSAETRENILASDVYFGNQAGTSAAQSDLLAMAVANDEDPTQVNQYQVMCTRWDPIWKRYRTFFPFSQLQMAPDQSTGFQTAKGTSFIYSNITSLKNQKSRLVYAEVPPISGIQLEGAICVDSFVGKGATVHPQVRVTNTGNLPLCGFTVNFCTEEGGTPYLSVPLTELENHVVTAQTNDVSSYLEEAAPASLTSNDSGSWGRDEESIIWPSSIRTYTMECKIPDAWESGTHEIYVTVSNPVVAQFDAAANSEESMLFAAEQNDASVLNMIDPRAATMPVDMSEFELEPASVAPCTYLPRGDVNGSGYTNIVDAQVAYDIACGQYSSREDYAQMKIRANVNGDEAVEANDAFAIQRSIHYGWTDENE